MRTQTSGRGPVWGTKAKELAAGLLVAAMMAWGMVNAAPAHASTTFVVNSTGDFHDTIFHDGFCGFGGSCSLRAAIEEANATPEADAITFDIPGTGVKSINVGSTGLGGLPAITQPVSIDGYTQPGASPNTKAVGDDARLKIELDGTGASVSEGLVILDSSNSVIKGLAIDRFGEGITIQGDSVGNRIEGNFVGTDPTGTLDEGNSDDGVNILDGASKNAVGGTTPAARNVISGNACNAVFVNSANENRVQGNYLGTDKTGTKAIPNGDGVACAAVEILNGSSGNTVGGTTAGARNLVSGNKSEGLAIQGGTQNEVLGNRIGTTAGGTGALGNGEAGVLLQGSNTAVGDGTAAGSNTIAFNAEDGVEVQSGAGNRISRNSVFSNAGLGIDLVGGFEDAQGNTANDPGDLDAGPNGLQNKPVISSAKSSSTKTTISGKLSGGPGRDYLIEFYSNPSGGEGKKFIGTKSVTTGSDGKATFAFSPAARVPVGQTVTGTAALSGRILAEEQSGTSEFSAPRQVAKS